MAPRAEIIDTGSRWAKAARIQVDAPAQAVFDVLADPAQHATFDGRTALFPPSLLLINAPANNQVAVARTLVRLKAHVEQAHTEQGNRP